MIFYLTYNDAYSGIYSSQVIDVVNHLNHHVGTNVKLIAFVSIRDFFRTRKNIQQELKSAIVLPMFPGVYRWRYNYFLLFLLSFFLKPKAIIGRSVLATNLALKLKNKFDVRKVVYDGRGAIHAEWKEYKVVNHPQLLANIESLEYVAIHQSDFRIAVSNALIAHWRTHFNYQGKAHVIIPCTVNKVFEQLELGMQSIAITRQNLGFNQTDLIFIYSGSVAGWQSFEILNQAIVPILKQSKAHKILFLSALDASITQLQSQFPDQVLCKKVQPFEVPQYLMLGDYGLLLREKSITNQVASPVKFAEYLACGLNVVISQDLGDYSEFVATHDCGIVYKCNSKLDLAVVSMDKKNRNQNLAKNYFYKEAEINKTQYIQLLESIN